MKRSTRLVFSFLAGASLLVAAGSVGSLAVPFASVAAAAAAQPARAGEGADAPGRIHALQITVRDVTTKQPVAGAEIVCWESTERFKALTDAGGTVVLNVAIDVPHADRMRRFDVTVIHPGYAQRRVMWIATAGRVRESLPAEYEILVSPGITAGGVVRDEHGAPVSGARILLSGSDYKGFRLGGDTKSHQEFSSVQTDEATAPITDEQGAWRKTQFPADLAQLSIDVIRPGGARARFVANSDGRMPFDRSTPIEMSAVKAGDVMLVVKEGFTVRGLVVDEASRPVSGVQLRARDATSRNPAHVFTNTPDGRFELPNWDVASVLVTAEHPQYRIATAKFPVGGDAAPGKITLARKRPLRLRVLGDNDSPLAGADVRNDPNPSDQILDWKATTDAEGRVVWETAPAAPVNLWIAPPAASGYPFRSAKLAAGAGEHVVRLRKGAEKSIAVRIHAIDAETGAPVPGFEVWRRVANAPFRPWGAPAEKGEFQSELATADLPRGFVPSYRLQVRATGYTGWASDPLEFSNGDLDLTIKLTKGESTLANETRPTPAPGMGIDGERNPALMVLAGSVARLLETGDVAAFVEATNASANDWMKLLPKGADPKEIPPMASPERVRRRGELLAVSGEHVLEIARRVGAAPGRLRFQVKSVSSPMRSSSGFKIAGQPVMMPFATALRVTLAAEPVSGAGADQLRGEYELSVGMARQMPGGWRTEEGVRWVAFPPGVADEATQRELRLTNQAASTSFRDQRTLSGTDDPALMKFAELVTTLLRDRAVPAFLAATTFSRDEIITWYQRHGWGQPDHAQESLERVTSGLNAAAQSMLDLQDRMAIDLSDAKLVVKQVLVERPSFTRFGQIDGLRGGPVRVTFAVESARTAKSGRPIAGDYVVALGDSVRANDRWLLIDDKIRWQEFPKGLLAEDEMKNVEFENYVAENRSLPPGHTVPEIEFVRLADATRESLSKYRGKVVILEFWAKWCGPCQEPMEKLQHLLADHPGWKDRVEVIALSIDEKESDAREHLATKGWSKTTNVWAGEGGWRSGAAKAFRVRGIPTAYIIDRDGKVVKAGHPMSMDFGALVDAQLRQARSSE